MKILNKIQKELKSPKGQYNTFGKYKYRNCEDILEAVKPLLGDSILTITDSIVMIGDRYYVKAIATIKDDKESIFTEAFARESEIKKGMDSAQVTGAASSYARKYALNGLFLIDDTKDSDSEDNSKTVDPLLIKKTKLLKLVKKLKSDIKNEEVKEFIETTTKEKLNDKNLDSIIGKLELSIEQNKSTKEINK